MVCLYLTNSNFLDSINILFLEFEHESDRLDIRK